uniref:Uncharacterized protein n=1 Tax=Haemonchus placei TaxID=6290 RepID=A0A0N4WE89_HAEPC
LLSPHHVVRDSVLQGTVQSRPHSRQYPLCLDTPSDIPHRTLQHVAFGSQTHTTWLASKAPCLPHHRI